jgi:hypothetical protein
LSECLVDGRLILRGAWIQQHVVDFSIHGGEAEQLPAMFDPGSFSHEAMLAGDPFLDFQGGGADPPWRRAPPAGFSVIRSLYYV